MGKHGVNKPAVWPK